MTKQIAEQSKALSIFWLKKHGYLNKDYSYNSGVITWTFGWGDNKSSIGFSISRDDWGTEEEKTYMELKYTHTDGWSGEKSDMNYKIPITTTPCNFGGHRNWFLCPLYKDNIYCGKRVGVLYQVGKYWGCRHCANIAYQAQLEGGSYRTGSVCEPDVEEAYNEIKRFYYKGKPTKRYQRYLRLREKMDNSWAVMLSKLGGKHY